MSAGPFTLRQLADALGVDANTVRVLLRCGLLQRPRRRRGRTGDVAFHEEHVERLAFIKRALGVGFHLDDIALLVDPSRLITCGDVYALASRRLNEMRRTKEDTRSLETLIHECRVRSQEGRIHPCPVKGGRKDCRILAKLHDFKGTTDRKSRRDARGAPW
jgi:MerR family mercuric resistance operon transcriptional regulator